MANVKISISELRSILEMGGFRSLSKTTKPKLNYLAAKLIKTVSEEMEDIEKQRKTILEKYWILDSDGNPIIEDTVMPDGSSGTKYKLSNQTAFEKEFNDFANTEIDLTITMLPENLINESGIPADELSLLVPFIEEDQGGIKIVQ